MREAKAGRVVSAAVGILLSAVGGCGGGQYGYARTYQPSSEEGPYLERAADLSYEEVRRARPEQQQMVGWFGVVAAPFEIAGDGSARVLLSLRAHQERHLCSDGSSDSCRVTVSEREIGRFVAVMTVHPEDRTGQRRLQQGSLVRVYGTATGEEDAENGPILRIDWYRHWPVFQYVTTDARRAMRR